MTDNRKKELERILEEKLKDFLKSNVPGVDYVEEYGHLRNYITLEVSNLCVTKCQIYASMWSYGNSTSSVSIYLSPSSSNSGFALNRIYSHNRNFKSDEDVENFFATSEIDEFFESFKDSDIYKYMTDEEFRSNTIKECELEELRTFENHFNELLKHVGGKKILSILAPLNNLVTYGGDFESVRNFVYHVSDILKENRELKMKNMENKKV